MSDDRLKTLSRLGLSEGVKTLTSSKVQEAKERTRSILSKYHSQKSQTILVWFPRAVDAIAFAELVAPNPKKVCIMYGSYTLETSYDLILVMADDPARENSFGKNKYIQERLFTGLSPVGELVQI